MKQSEIDLEFERLKKYLDYFIDIRIANTISEQSFWYYYKNLGVLFNDCLKHDPI